MITIPIQFKESAGIPREQEPVTFGVPFPRGALHNIDNLNIIDEQQRVLPTQVEKTASWPDGSVRWTLVKTQVSIPARESLQLLLKENSDIAKKKSPSILITETQDHLTVNTGKALFKINASECYPLESVEVSGSQSPQKQGKTILVDDNGVEFFPLIKKIQKTNESGTVNTTVSLSGSFTSADKQELVNFTCRLTFTINSACVKIDFSIHNPRAAVHNGGLWDLGDPGSVLFKELAIYVDTSTHHDLQWKESTEDAWKHCKSENFSIYQDSSGGNNWQGNVHKNREGEVCTRFKGYKCHDGNQEVSSGFRASPVVYSGGNDSGISAYIEKFWQNFPKAFSSKGSKLALQLFPNQASDLFELQGGEKKTHTLYIDFSGEKDSLNWAAQPLIGKICEKWWITSNTLPYLCEPTSNEPIDTLIYGGIEGESTFFSKREKLDEYGWRNFGELYADHEAIEHKGDQPLVSHYNNQYDPLFGFCRQWAISGDTRWFELMDDLAKHITDIDIYHTQLDRDAYNGGLFWHTDHYLDASTCTHRTFSQGHAGVTSTGKPGGGPGNEHCYGTGLLYHYYLTGNPNSKDALLMLSDWVIKANDGSGTVCEALLGIKSKFLPKLKKVLKGEKTLTHKYPMSRATGNYINTLLDTYLLTDDRAYIEKVETIIVNSVHPKDDIGLRNLEDIETTWSYTIFLQSIIRFIQHKELIGEEDSYYQYAKDALLHYAHWMLTNETPYLEKPEILEYPNHTWVAQEIRKANIFYAAHQYSRETGSLYLERANYFIDYITTNLKNSDSKTLTRILVLLLQNHGPHSYFLASNPQPQKNALENGDETSISYSNPTSILSGILRELGNALRGFSLSGELTWLGHRIPQVKKWAERLSRGDKTHQPFEPH